MRRLGSVQQKIPCVFLTEVREEPSRKRDCQHFQIVATENVNPLALESNIDCALATEKLDGTCCYVTTYNGFTWNVEDDFKSVPDSWISAHRVQHENGHPVPDEHGHIPGWVPVENTNKQYCWHASVVNYEEGLALVLRPHPEDEDLLEIVSVPLSELMEQTLELIGTNVNGNPYGLGSKKHPVHVLAPHGILRVRNAPPVEYQQLYSWFQESHEGRVEGIVWHCNDGTLIKVHRHHLGLKWPTADTFLNSRPIVVHVDGARYNSEALTDPPKNLFSILSSLNGQHFNSIQGIQFEH
ncbi:RNA ligase 1 isoform X2 [Hoplias malabaricus]|uniref:RNA ligase 1 isoform X2 n=1 Tax=Hoplias malabaricus TaxID=27720 RepID=UPI0034636D4C